MRVLIVEDKEFNGFCLGRLLESALVNSSVTIANNSNQALSFFYSTPFEWVIIGGELGTSHDPIAYCNGQELAQILLSKYPQVCLIAWTDSESTRQAFRHAFKQNNGLNDGLMFWSKAVSIETIVKTWAHYITEFDSSKSMPYLQSQYQTKYHQVEYR
jgi:CheY-like chemotaxis protein